MSDVKSPVPVAANGKRKTWREIQRERKDTRKQYREENLLKKLEKQKKREQVEKEKLKQEKAEKVPPKVSTISIAVPGSILDNAQLPLLRTMLAGQIAREACVSKVDEIIVYDDNCATSAPKRAKMENSNESDDNDDAVETVQSCCIQMGRILQYLECPQYLRKDFFPIHKDLKFCGVLHPLDAPHHLRTQNDFIFREGIVTKKPPKQSRGSYVNIGLQQECLVDKILTPGLRVTVKLDAQNQQSKKLRGKIVSPSLPRAETGIYWGYTVRIARCFSDVFTNSPYPDGYDLTIGTSDKGESVYDIEKASLPFDHALIVFGGLQGLEGALDADDKLNVDDPSLLFDHYLNTVPDQGTRTVRTEEAIPRSLAVLKDKLNPNQKPKEFDLSHSIPQSEDTGMRQTPTANPFVGNTRKRNHSDEAVSDSVAAVDEGELSRFD